MLDSGMSESSVVGLEGPSSTDLPQHEEGEEREEEALLAAQRHLDHLADVGDHDARPAE